MTIIVAHEYRDVVKLLMKNYDTNMNDVESYSLYATLREQ